MDQSRKHHVVIFLRCASLVMFRFLSIGGGMWLSAMVPVVLGANNRRAANMAAGHMPNMDPGVTASFALLGIAIILVAIIFVEIIRCWVFEYTPLSFPSYVALGIVTASPIGYSMSFEDNDSFAFLYALLGGVSLHYMRCAWLVYRKRWPRVTGK